MFDEDESTGDASSTVCRANNKKGEPCAAPATDTGYCHVHSKPGRAAEIGREGGRRNRQVADTTLPPLGDLSTSFGIRNAIGLIIPLIYTGQLNARRGMALVSLFSTLQRVLHDTEPAEIEQLQERVRALEKAVAEKASDPLVSKEDKLDHGSVSGTAQARAASA